MSGEGLAQRESRESSDKSVTYEAQSVCKTAQVTEPVKNAICLAIPVVLIQVHIHLEADKLVAFRKIGPRAGSWSINLHIVKNILLLLAKLQKADLILNFHLFYIGFDVLGYRLAYLHHVEF